MELTSALLFCCLILLGLSILFLQKGIKDYLSEVNVKLLMFGIGMGILFLENCLALNLLYSDSPFFSCIIWIIFAVLLITTIYKSSKTYKYVKYVIGYLNQFPEYKEISDNLFVGLINFGTSMPPRGYRKERQIYEKGIKAFTCLKIKDDDAEILHVQRIFRKSRLYTFFTVGSALAFCLQIVVFTLFMIFA